MLPVVETSNWLITIHRAPEYNPYHCFGDPKVSGSFELECSSEFRSSKLFAGGTINLILIQDDTRIKLPKALLIGVRIHDVCNYRNQWCVSTAND